MTRNRLFICSFLPDFIYQWWWLSWKRFKLRIRRRGTTWSSWWVQLPRMKRCKIEGTPISGRVFPVRENHRGWAIHVHALESGFGSVRVNTRGHARRNYTSGCKYNEACVSLWFMPGCPVSRNRPPCSPWCKFATNASRESTIAMKPSFFFFFRGNNARVESLSFDRYRFLLSRIRIENLQIEFSLENCECKFRIANWKSFLSEWIFKLNLSSFPREARLSNKFSTNYFILYIEIHAYRQY